MPRYNLTLGGDLCVQFVGSQAAKGVGQKPCRPVFAALTEPQRETLKRLMAPFEEREKRRFIARDPDFRKVAPFDLQVSPEEASLLKIAAEAYRKHLEAHVSSPSSAEKTKLAANNGKSGDPLQRSKDRINACMLAIGALGVIEKL